MLTSDDLDRIEQYAFNGGQVDCATVIDLCEEVREQHKWRRAQSGPVTVQRYQYKPPTEGWRAAGS